MSLVWVDLCSGLGGASQPALDRGWEVLRIDNKPKFKPDIVADIRTLLTLPQADVLWASPPCQEFSKFEMRCFFPNPPEPDLSIALAVKRLIREHKPRYWVVENVRASRPWLNKIFGPVRIRVPGHVLFSNLLFLVPNIEPHKGSFQKDARWGSMSHAERKRRHGAHGSFTGGGNNKDAADAAKIPYEIGEAICRAVEARSVMDFSAAPR